MPEEAAVLTGTIEEVAEKAEAILKTVAPTAYAAAQEWDDRIDCLIRLPDGSVVGEMVSLGEATEGRIREAGERIQKKFLGISVLLRDELWAPIRIVRDSGRS